MVSVPTLLIVSTTAFIVGILLSLLLNRSLSSNKRKARLLENRVKKAEESLSSYKQHVTEHFAETAKRVNHLTQTYKELHEHFVSSALKLANVDIGRQLLSTNITDDDLELNINDGSVEIPKDWSPTEGTLSEDYGLDIESEVLFEASS